MEMKSLVEVMRCPNCESDDLELGPAGATCSSCATLLAVSGMNIHAASGRQALSDEWVKKQDDSVERYTDEHYNEDDTDLRIFGGFIATSLKPEELILDVGCGLTETKPSYARDLRSAGYVGLEPLATPVNRDYLCITGAVAEKLPIRDSSFGAILLATSLDHIEHVDDAIAELKRITTPDGRLYFWVGLHEPEAMARAKSFHSIFFRTKGIKRVLRIAAAYAEYGWFMWRMAKNSRALRKGIPLDTAHFRYYTQDSLLQELERNGLEVRRKLLIPGSNSILLEAVPRNAA